MYRDAELRMPCSHCGVDYPKEQLEIVPGGFRCSACTYGKHRAPLSVVCNGCRQSLATRDATIVGFGTGYLCAGCTERAGALLSRQHADFAEDQQRRARRVRTGLMIAIAAGTALIWMFQFY